MTRDRSICGRYFAFVVAFAAAVGMKKKKKYHLRYIPHVQHPYILSIRSNAAHAIIQNGCIQIPLESGPFLGIWRLEV